MSQRVLLLASHHTLKDEEGFPGLRTDEPSVGHEARTMTPQMLKWPIYPYRSDRPETDSGAYALRECLDALLDLTPFTSAITLWVSVERKRLHTTRFDWCHIYFEGKRVLNLTRNHSGQPFENFTEWPQGEMAEKVVTWDKTLWCSFFYTQIQQALCAEKRRAEQIAEEYGARTRWASRALIAVPPL